MLKLFAKNRGSVALIGVLIIAAFTILLAIGMAEGSISSGYQYVNRSAKKVSMYSAEGCFEEALHRLELDSSYSGSILNFPDGNCAIVVSGGGTKTIDITLTYLDYIQTFRGTVTLSTQGHATNASLSTWDEI